MSDDDVLSVDDLVTGKAAEQLGEGVIPAHALLIVSAITEAGPNLRYVVSSDTPGSTVLGMLRSVTLKVEADDLASWGGDEDEG